MIDTLTLKNFTSFQNLEIKFSPKINVIIGENGTGKTHLLKSLYFIMDASRLLHDLDDSNKNEANARLTERLLRIFLPKDKTVSALQKNGAKSPAKIIASQPNGKSRSVEFNSRSRSLDSDYTKETWGSETEPVFIPTKEVFSLIRGLSYPNADPKTLDEIFDDTYLDLARRMMKPGHADPDANIEVDPRYSSVIPEIVNLIGGRFIRSKEGFEFEPGHYTDKKSSSSSRSKEAMMYLDTSKYRFFPDKSPRFSSNMTAEGFRKIGVLYRLLTNDGLIPGVSTPLLWDEPEANLNPKLMEKLVAALLALSRNGQQVILVTHDYVLLKWFDLLMDKKDKEDHVRFHVLYRDPESNENKVDSTDDYREIEKNPISEAYKNLTIAHARLQLKGANR